MTAHLDRKQRKPLASRMLIAPGACRIARSKLHTARSKPETIRSKRGTVLPPLGRAVRSFGSPSHLSKRTPACRSPRPAVGWPISSFETAIAGFETLIPGLDRAVSSGEIRILRRSPRIRNVVTPIPGRAHFERGRTFTLSRRSWARVPNTHQWQSDAARSVYPRGTLGRSGVARSRQTSETLGAPRETTKAAIEDPTDNE